MNKKEVAMKTFVKKDVCIGCGACTVIADQVFEIGDDGLAEVKQELRGQGEDVNTAIQVSEEEMDNVKDASESCPVGAIETQE